MNGTHIKNLAQLQGELAKVQDGFLEIVTENGKLMLDVVECRAAAPHLLRICNMRACHSSDLVS